MDSPTLILTDLPELSDESIAQVSECLYALAYEFEGHYHNQLQRYYQTYSTSKPPAPPESSDPPEGDLFEGFDEMPF